MTLKEQIQNYNPYNIQEALDKEYILQFMNIFEDTLTRKNVFGHFSSSAFVVNKERNKMVVVYHKILDNWFYPGGHADGEANLLNVAHREVLEETGLDAKILSPNIFSIQLFAVPTHVRKGNHVSAHMHLDTVYLFEADDTIPLKYREDESSGIKWISFEDAMKKEYTGRCSETYKKLINKIRKENSVVT